ncbi:uncharacterized protein LOC123983499 isoform X2 [Micropterus dolomieu]|uniref:uncharacterized protein LOC123983499 isoform X2 n=1 Tax=Micropterus dolomieu TaxID=147949 RepID=UPI001E8E04B8|nr:uncharacterized protein LOC123983499 isoform X2 [Micropterus dolomieu]
MVMRYVSATMWAEQSLNFIIWSTRVPFYPDQLLRSRIKSKLGQHGSSPGCLSSPLRDHRTSRGAWSCCLGPVDRVLLLFNPKKKFLPSSCNDCIYVRGGLTSLTTCQQGRSRYHQRRTIVACESLSGSAREPVRSDKDTSFCLTNAAERRGRQASRREMASVQQHGAYSHLDGPLQHDNTPWSKTCIVTKWLL